MTIIVYFLTLLYSKYNVNIVHLRFHRPYYGEQFRAGWNKFNKLVDNSLVRLCWFFTQLWSEKSIMEDFSPFKIILALITTQLLSGCYPYVCIYLNLLYGNLYFYFLIANVSSQTMDLWKHCQVLGPRGKQSIFWGHCLKNFDCRLHEW